MKNLLPALCFFIATFGFQAAQAQFTVNGPATICTGSPGTLTATNCGGTLQWSTGETTASITVSPAVTTTYYVTCTVGNASTTGSLSPIVVPGLQLNSNVGNCFIDQSILSVPGVPSGSNLRWEKDGILIPGAGGNSYTATQSGTYSVKSDIASSAWTWQNLLPDGENFNDIYFVTDLLGVAVGDYGKIVRTTDGGQTWNRVNYLDKYDLTSVYFTSPIVGWIVGRENILLKTTDGGLSWNRHYLNGNFQNLSRVQFADPDRGWILDRSTASVLKTVNGGIKWNVVFTLNNVYLQDLFFADSLNGWLLQSSGQIRKTSDGGLTWTSPGLAPSPTSEKLFFVNAQIGWMTGPGSFFKTYDGGDTWTNLSTQFPNNTDFKGTYFTNDHFGLVLTRQGIYRSTDGGSSWYMTSTPAIDPQTVFMRSPDKTWVAGKGGRVLTGYQVGASFAWKITLGAGIGANESFLSSRTPLDFVNNQVGWAGNGNEFMLKTTNGGKIWTPTSLKDVYDVDFVDENTGYAVAKASGAFPAAIYKSTDGGDSWNTVYNFVTNGLPKIQFANINTGWAVNFDNNVYRTTDGGNTWSTSPISFPGYDLFFTDAINGWVNGGAGQVAKTTDGGLTWTNVNAGANGIQAIYFKNSNEGWIMGSPTRKTIDGGITWTNNLIDGTLVNFRNLAFTDSNFGIALSSTLESNGGLIFYKTLNGGTSWTKQSIPTHTKFSEISLTDSASAWISDGRGAIMHYAASIPTCAASLTLQQSPPAPTVTASTHNALCEGESITLTASGCPDALSWSDGSTGATITVKPYSSTTYTAFCGGSNGCKGATYTGVAVIPKIRLDTSVNAPCIRPNFAASNSFFGVDLIWRKDGVEIPDQNYTSLTATSPGTYTAEPNVAGAWASQTGNLSNAKLNDITFASPSVGFAVGEVGMILKTTDGGSSWKTLPSGTTDAFRRIIAVSPQTAWAFGIYGTIKTTDGGDTWKRLGLGGTDYPYDMSFTNENVGWAVTSNKIFYTSDGGAHWTTQYFNGPQGYNRLQAVDANTAYTISYNKISRTTDGGATWTTTSLPAGRIFNDLYFIDATHGWVVGGNSAIIYTSDGGVTWITQTVPQSFPAVVQYNFYQVQFSDTMNGWARAGNDIFVTSNGGLTWIPSSGLSEFRNTERFFLKTPTEGFIVGGVGLLARTKDGAATWQEVGGVLKTSNILLSKVQFVNNTTGFVVGEEGLLLKTVDGGKNWMTRSIPHEGIWYLYDAFFFDENHGWILASGRLYSTTDGGLSWTTLVLPDAVYGIQKLYFVNASTGWGVDPYGKIAKTTDGGLTWTAQTSNTSEYLASVFFLDANRGWAVGNAGTFRATTDGGATWTAQDTGFSNGSFRSVQFTSPTSGWLVSTNQLLHTTDGGVSWQKVSIDKSYVYIIHKLQFVSDSTGFVLSDKFVYATKDAGATWQKTYAYENYTDISFTDARHGWVVGFNSTILAYHPATAPCQSEPIVVTPQSIEPISTRLSGDWNTPYVWSCGLVPTVLDDVRINAEHTITLPDGYAAKAKSVDLRGQIQYSANANLQMGKD